MTSSTTARSRALREVPPRAIPGWTLGERLRKIRRHLGIGQQEFAEQLGENRKTYAAWELDTNTPRNIVALAQRIQMMTGYSAGWVLGLDDNAQLVEPAVQEPATAVTQSGAAAVVPATRCGRGPNAEKCC